MLHRALRIATVPLLVACDSRPPVSDAQRYAEILGDTRLSPEAGMPRCDLLQDSDLRGDCALTVASRSPEAERWCPSVPAGVWQEECWFIAAEQRNRRRDADGAAALCRAAGRFRLDCAQHLWQTPVHALIHARGAAGFVEALPRAEALYQTWAPLLVEQSDFQTRFWAKFYGNGFEGQGLPVDLGWCAPLPTPAHRTACEEAGAAHYARELGPVVERSGELAAFCALETPSATRLARWLAAEPHPRLDAEAQARQQDICTHAPGAPGAPGGGSPVPAPPAPSTTPRSPGR